MEMNVRYRQLTRRSVLFVPWRISASALDLGTISSVAAVPGEALVLLSQLAFLSLPIRGSRSGRVSDTMSHFITMIRYFLSPFFVGIL